jgi:bifunctional non-homologous end joining protein LigD
MAERAGRAGFIEPMKARLVERPQPGSWIYEIKLDGFRAPAIKNGAEVELLSRNNKDLAGKFPEVARAVARIKAKDAIIDGEIVALEDSGRSSFQLLQAYDLGEARPPIIFYAFDLLRLNGKDLRQDPLAIRKAALEKLLADPPDCVRYSASLEGDVENLLEQARKLGLEGLIGKRKDSLYEAGQRSGSWIKLKITREQEFVIGGYTNPQGSRKFFGSLIVGFYEKEKLLFAGKVGTGFNETSLRALHRELEKIRIPNCPFKNLPERKGDRYSPGLTASEMKKCHWVEPKLVAQIRYTEWTRDNKLRHPVYLGLRHDKSAKEVVRETPV